MKKMMFAAIAALMLSVGFSSCSKSPEEKALSAMRQLVEMTEKVKSNALQALDLADDIAALKEEINGMKVNELNFTPEQKKEFDELTKKVGSGIGSIFGF